MQLNNRNLKDNQLNNGNAPDFVDWRDGTIYYSSHDAKSIMATSIFK